MISVSKFLKRTLKCALKVLKSRKRYVPENVRAEINPNYECSLVYLVLRKCKNSG